jgi:hypothetical protein
MLARKARRNILPERPIFRKEHIIKISYRKLGF